MEQVPSAGAVVRRAGEQTTPVEQGALPEETVVDCFRRWCQAQPDKILYTWLDEQGSPAAAWSYRDVEQRADAVARKLLTDWRCSRGDRAALMYLPGLEFIAGFWGCLFAGVVAVPVYPVDLRGATFEVSVERFGRIVAECEAKLVLSHGDYLQLKRLHGLKNALTGTACWPEGLQFHATDELEPCGDRHRALPSPEQLAFLQFTSGSTGDPKGVMLSHANLVANQEALKYALGGQSKDVACSWLPQYHDAGLIGIQLLIAYSGASCVLMAPMAFIREPFVWLEAMSKSDATNTCAPNFAYDLCVRKINAKEKNSLDLSKVTSFANGAEPVTASVVETFLAEFSICGVKPGSMSPTYGMAEYVVFATNRGPKLREPCILNLDQAAIEQGVVRVSPALPESRYLVSCGVPGPGIGITIADLQTLAEAAPDQVGEIWVSGPSKAQGYWGKPELSQETFRATIKDDPTGTEYLRTGDLGFIHEGELYICGRLKDLIIINGRNIYPQDIERSAEAVHSSIRPGCSAAFGVELDGEEGLVLVAEVRGNPSQLELQQIIQVIMRIVSKEHQLRCQAILLLKERTVPKTTSGKIRRKACKQGFLEWQQQSAAGNTTSGSRVDGMIGRIAHWFMGAGSSNCPSALLQVVASSDRDESTALPVGHADAVQVQDPAVKPAITLPGLSDSQEPVGSSADHDCKVLLEAIKTKVLQEVLKVIKQDCLTADEPLADTGLPSIKAVEAVASLSESLKRDLGISAVKLPSSLLLEASTVSKVAALVASQISIGSRPPAALPVVQGSDRKEPVYLTGMACTLANNTCSPDELWFALALELCYIGNPAPPARWEQACKLANAPSAVLVGAFLSEKLESALQHPLGGFSTAEASQLDMHVQLLLDTSLRALADAGLKGVGNEYKPMGVFTGSQPSDFVQPSSDFTIARSMAATLKVSGPHHNYNLACSSGYLATHHAKQALQAGECPAGAVVAGVSLLLKPDTVLSLYMMGILSPSSTMRPFDKAADGMVWGEASGALVLQLVPAQELKRYCCRLEGSAANCNSAISPSGFVDPDMIQAVAEAALAAAKIELGQLAVCHPHGMGTLASDLPELTGLLGAVAAELRQEPLVLAGHKANFGHSVCAAGLISMVVSSLALRHSVVPVHLGVTNLVRILEQTKERVLLPVEVQAGFKDGALGHGSVSGTSVSGDNVHLVLSLEVSKGDTQGVEFSGPTYPVEVATKQPQHQYVRGSETQNQPQRHHLAPSQKGPTDLQRIVTETIKAQTGLELAPDQSFISAGVSSAQVVGLVASLNRQQGVMLAPVDIYRHPTVTSLAECLADQITTPAASESQNSTSYLANHETTGWDEVEETTSYPAGTMQRYYFLNQLFAQLNGDKPRAMKNIGIHVQHKGVLNVKMLEQSLNAAVARHEALRTCFSMDADKFNEVMATVVETLTVPLDVHDLVQADAPWQKLVDLAEEWISKPFELEVLPLIRVYLVRIKAQHHVLMVVAHHIVSDAESLSLFVQDVLDRSRVYHRVLPYSAWLRKQPAQQESEDNTQTYPAAAFQSDCTGLQYERGYCSLTLDLSSSAEMYQCCALAGISPFFVIVAALGLCARKDLGLSGHLSFGTYLSPRIIDPALQNWSIIGCCTHPARVTMWVDEASTLQSVSENIHIEPHVNPPTLPEAMHPIEVTMLNDERLMADMGVDSGWSTLDTEGEFGHLPTFTCHNKVYFVFTRSMKRMKADVFFNAHKINGHTIGRYLQDVCMLLGDRQSTSPTQRPDQKRTTEQHPQALSVTSLSLEQIGGHPECRLRTLASAASFMRPRLTGAVRALLRRVTIMFAQRRVVATLMPNALRCNQALHSNVKQLAADALDMRLAAAVSAYLIAKSDPETWSRVHEQNSYQLPEQILHAKTLILDETADRADIFKKLRRGAQRTFHVQTCYLFPSAALCKLFEEIVDLATNHVTVRILVDRSTCDTAIEMERHFGCTRAGMEGYKTVGELLLTLSKHPGVYVALWDCRDLGAGYQLKNHRKMTVVDGTIALLGSSNLLPPSVFSIESDILIQGAAAKALDDQFIKDWTDATSKLAVQVQLKPVTQENSQTASAYFEQAFHWTSQTAHVAILNNAPSQKGDDEILRAALWMMRNARSHIRIAMGFLCLSTPVIKCLCAAVDRGVLVQIVVSQMDLHWPLNDMLASLSVLLDQCPQAQIICCDSVFMHSKLIVCDGRYTIIGSWNLWVLSSFLEAETVAFIDCRQTAQMIDSQILRVITLHGGEPAGSIDGLRALWGCWGCPWCKTVSFVQFYSPICTQEAQRLDAEEEDGSEVLDGVQIATLNEWCATAQPFHPVATPVHGLFEVIASESNAEYAALRFQLETISYRNVEQLSSCIASRLIELDSQWSVIGLCTERSTQEVAFMVGIMRAFSAYMPLDPKYPAKRLQYLVNQCSAAAVVAQRSAVGRIDGWFGDDVHLLCAEDTMSQKDVTKQALVGSGDKDCPAYVLFTSGTTGKPKGVTVAHSSLTALVASAHDISPRISLQEVSVLYSIRFTFDPSVGLVWFTLTTGAGLVIAKPGALMDPMYLRDLLLREEIIFTHLVPGALTFYMDVCRQEMFPASLATLYLSGEALSNKLVMRVHEAGTHIQLWNRYGPAESTVDTHMYRCTFTDIEQQKPIPIGKLLPSSTCLVLSQNLNLQPCPIGVPGELFLGGPKLAQGYVSRPDLTSASFAHYHGLRLYATGDRCCWHSSGEMEYQGRIDFQIKLNGQRIELHEIEKTVSDAPGVHDALVLLNKSGQGLDSLVGYVVPQRSSASDVIEFCCEMLPEYMVPSNVIVLSAWPFNQSGKIDRRALTLCLSTPVEGDPSALTLCLSTPVEGDPSAPEQSAKPTELDQGKQVTVHQVSALFGATLGRSVTMDENLLASGLKSQQVMALCKELTLLYGHGVGPRQLIASPTVQQLHSSLQPQEQQFVDEMVDSDCRTPKVGDQSLALEHRNKVDRDAPNSSLHNGGPPDAVQTDENLAVVSMDSVTRDPMADLSVCSVQELLEVERDDLLDALVSLEKVWPEPMQQDQGVLRDRISRAPMWQIVMFQKKQSGVHIVGSLYAQRIASADSLFEAKYHQVAELHANDGSLLQLIGIQVDPRLQCGSSSLLLEYVFDQAKQASLKQIVAVTRCRSFCSLSEDLELGTALMMMHIKDGDPGVQFHTSRGADVLGLVPQYRPEDIQNAGIGVLVAYTLSETETAISARVPDATLQHTIVATINLCADAITNCIIDSADTSFADAGFDSFDMVNLAEQLSDKLGVMIPMSAIYDNGTTTTMIKYVLSHADGKVPSRSLEPMHSTRLSITGLSCRLAGNASYPSAAWTMLLQGLSSIEAVGPQRWIQACQDVGLASSLPGTFVDDSEQILPVLCERYDSDLDSHFHLVSNAIFEALRDARSNRGIETWALFSAIECERLVISIPPWRVSWVLANLFQFSGPHQNFDATCASSYLAVCAAAEFLKSSAGIGCIVAGVALSLKATSQVQLLQAGILSASGQLRPLDKFADGSIIGEGCGAIVIEPCSSQGYSEIVGWGQNKINSQSLYGVPDESKICAAIDSAMTNNSSEKSSMFVHLHATGNPNADIPEVRAAIHALGCELRFRPLLLTGHKGSFGHTEPASGLIAAITSTLILCHKMVPPQRKVQSPVRTISSKPDILLPIEQPVCLSFNPDIKIAGGINGHSLSGDNTHIHLSGTALKHLSVCYITVNGSLQPGKLDSPNQLETHRCSALKTTIQVQKSASCPMVHQVSALFGATLGRCVSMDENLLASGLKSQQVMALCKELTLLYGHGVGPRQLIASPTVQQLHSSLRPQEQQVVDEMVDSDGRSPELGDQSLALEQRNKVDRDAPNSSLHNGAQDCVVITFGTYDLFHYGHLRILERAAELGTRLVVGVSSDALNWSKKRKHTVISELQRMAIIKGLQCVDEVFLEESLENTQTYCLRYQASILVMGDDHLAEYDLMLKDVCECIYLPGTDSVSTTLLRQRLSCGSLCHNQLSGYAIIGQGLCLPGVITETCSFWSALCASEEYVSSIEQAPQRWLQETCGLPLPVRCGSFLPIESRQLVALLTDVANAAQEDARGCLHMCHDSFLLYVACAEPCIANELKHALCCPDMVCCETPEYGCTAGHMAVVRACDGLQKDDCAVAVVVAGQLAAIGPAPVTSDQFVPPGPDQRIVLAELALDSGFLSPTGRTCAFSIEADGMVRGEAAAALVLTSMNQIAGPACRLHSTILGYGSSPNGRTLMPGQVDLSAEYQAIQRAHASRSFCSTEQATHVVECVANGTLVGDVADLEIASHLWSTGGAKSATPVAVGGLNANFSHCPAACGLLSVIKAAVMMGQHIIPPNINMRRPHSQGRNLVIPSAQTIFSAPQNAYSAVHGRSANGPNVHFSMMSHYVPCCTLWLKAICWEHCCETPRTTFTEKRCHLASRSGTEQTSSKPVPVREDEPTPSHPSAQPFSFIRFEEDKSSVEVMVLPVSQMSASPVHIQEAVRPPSRLLIELQHSLEEDVWSPPVPVTYHPVLTRPGYTSSPPIEALRALPVEMLQHISGFRLERSGFGSVEWERAVDLTGANLDLVEITGLGVQLPGSQLPSLNRSCVITALKALDAAALEKDPKLLNKLKKKIVRIGAEFIDYSPEHGEVRFRVSRFNAA